MFDINIALAKDDFLSNGGILCARNKTSGASEDGVVECMQPTKSQYVTILNLVHIGSTRSAYAHCMTLCEIKVFVKGNEMLFPHTLIHFNKAFLKIIIKIMLC